MASGVAGLSPAVGGPAGCRAAVGRSSASAGSRRTTSGQDADDIPPRAADPRMDEQSKREKGAGKIEQDRQDTSWPAYSRSASAEPIHEQTNTTTPRYLGHIHPGPGPSLPMPLPPILESPRRCPAGWPSQPPSTEAVSTPVFGQCLKVQDKASGQLPRLSGSFYMNSDRGLFFHTPVRVRYMTC